MCFWQLWVDYKLWWGCGGRGDNYKTPCRIKGIEMYYLRKPAALSLLKALWYVLLYFQNNRSYQPLDQLTMLVIHQLSSPSHVRPYSTSTLPTPTSLQLFIPAFLVFNSISAPPGFRSGYDKRIKSNYTFVLKTLLNNNSFTFFCSFKRLCKTVLITNFVYTSL